MRLHIELILLHNCTVCSKYKCDLAKRNFCNPVIVHKENCLPVCLDFIIILDIFFWEQEIY